MMVMWTDGGTGGVGWRGLRAVYDGDVDCWRKWVVGWRGLCAAVAEQAAQLHKC